MGRKWKVWHERRPARRDWQGRAACGYCRKRAYDSRGDAKRALRAVFPAAVGASMTVYRCPHGGPGWHVGHRNPLVEQQPMWPTWTDAEVEQPCQRCPQVIGRGEPVAWLDGFALCLDCGDEAEQEVLAS